MERVGSLINSVYSRWAKTARFTSDVWAASGMIHSISEFSSLIFEVPFLFSPSSICIIAPFRFICAGRCNWVILQTLSVIRQIVCLSYCMVSVAIALVASMRPLHRNACAWRPDWSSSLICIYQRFRRKKILLKPVDCTRADRRSWLRKQSWSWHPSPLSISEKKFLQNRRTKLHSPPFAPTLPVDVSLSLRGLSRAPEHW